MKKELLLIATVIGMTGCSSMIAKNVDTLKAPTGNGALAITTLFDISGSYPCQRFYLDITEKLNDSVENPRLAAEPIKLNFFPDADTKYVLFDGIKPGGYVLKELRCYPAQGYVFNKNKSYLELKGRVDLEIKANKITLSKGGFSGEQDGNGGFSFRFSEEGDNQSLLKQTITPESKVGWSFY